jgi:hypothetical protein
MKKLFYIISLIAVATITAVSCQQKEEPHQPGPAENPGCYGVFFPSQAASGDHIFNPTQEKSLDITLKRTNTSGSITVPVKASFSEDGVFSVGEAIFADGQEETTFTVRFDNAKEGVTYKASFEIDDNSYASLYNSNPIALDFSVMCVEMKYFKADESQAEPTVVHWEQPWWGESVDTYIKYYEVDGVRTCFTETLTSTHKYKGEYYDGFGFWGAAGGEGEGEWSFIWYPNAKDDDGNQYIHLLSQYTGYHHGSYDTDVWVYDGYGMDADYSGASLGSFLDEIKAGHYNYSYYDGNGGFYLYTEWYYMTGVGGWHVATIDNYGIAEGFVRVDYSIEVEQAGVSENGEVPVAFKLGADVAKVVCNFAEGSLTPTQIGNVAATLSADDPNALTDGPGVYSLNLGTTGTYTLVAGTFDDKGNLQEVASCGIIYLAAEDIDEYEVNVSGGLGSAAKYAASGISTDTALEFFVYGMDITDAKVGAFTLADLYADYDGCVAKLMASKSLSAAAIEAINGSGYVDVFTNLLPGTEYYMLVYASNGFAETVRIFGSECTTGDPLPIYRNFSVNDINPELLPATSEGYFGTYNFYGINYFDNETGLREYVGKVTIADSEVPDSEPDDDGLIDEYVEISGIFADAASKYGFDDTQLWDFYNGVLYNLAEEGQQLGAAAGGAYYAQLFVFASEAGGIYRGYPSMLIAGFVDDGYIAFASSELYNSGTLGEDGLFLRFYSDEAYSSVAGNVDAFTDLLLVDPAKDDNGVAPKGVAARQAQLRGIQKDIQEPRTNYVQTTRAYIRSIIDKHNKSVNIYNSVAGVKGGTLPIREVNVKSVTYTGPVSQVSFRESNRPVQSYVK